MEKPGKIFTQISKVMGEIGSIGKDRKNTMQGYSFRGIDDAYNAIQPALIKHNVFCVPIVLSREREERQTKNGGTLLYTILNVKFIFYAEDGSNVECETVGEAMDSGDKSCNKAMSAAQKYAFFQTFCIPTEEVKDAEAETHEVAPRSSKPTGRTAEPQRKSAAAKPKDAISEGQHRLLEKKLNDKGISREDFKAHFDIEHVNHLPADKINEALKSINEGKIKRGQVICQE